jgi:glycosyltransferase involved in cell wall biosynthesis
LKVGLDATYSVGDNLSGVGVYSHEILRRLPLAHPEAQYLFCYRPHRFLRSLNTPLPPHTRRALLWKNWPRTVDLFHGLNQRIDSTGFSRTVSTFHDLFVMTGDYSTSEFRRRFTLQARLAAQRSDLIIAVSQFTADQVHDLLQVERDRIRVVHHGCDIQGMRQGSPDRLILFVGAIQKRKNIGAVVKAFEQTAPGWKLVLVGSMGYGVQEIVAGIERSPRQTDIEMTGYISREALERLYSRAAIFAFPSLDEGFGIPVLEAMARGIPVLTSDGSALREVAGDAALLVNPREVDSVTAGLIRLTENEELRKELAERGRIRSAGFTWEKALEQTWNVYRELS